MPSNSHADEASSRKCMIVAWRVSGADFIVRHHFIYTKTIHPCAVIYIFTGLCIRVKHTRRLESIKARRGAAKEANRKAAKERKEREEAQSRADSLRRESNNIAVRVLLCCGNVLLFSLCCGGRRIPVPQYEANNPTHTM